MRTLNSLLNLARPSIDSVVGVSSVLQVPCSTQHQLVFQVILIRTEVIEVGQFLDRIVGLETLEIVIVTSIEVGFNCQICESLMLE